MHIRRANINDVPILGKLTCALGNQHADNEPVFIDKQLMHSFDGETYIREYLQGENNIVLVVEESNEVIGYCMLQIQDMEPFFNDDKVLYVDEIYVKKSHREHGIAKQLLDEAENIARKNQIRLLKARVYKFNKNPQYLFTNKNYKELYSEFFKRIEEEPSSKIV